MRKGKSFVTNGPMLELSVNKQSIGDTLRLVGPAKVHVVATARAQFPLSKVELISN